MLKILSAVCLGSALILAPVIAFADDAAPPPGATAAPSDSAPAAKPAKKHVAKKKPAAKKPAAPSSDSPAPDAPKS